MTALDTATAGQVFGPYDVTIDPKRADAYESAVGGAESPDYEAGLPPIAIVAAGLTKLINELGLAGGTIHLSQEAEFFRQVRAGEPISASAELKANSVRRGSRFATLFVEYSDGNGKLVATSSSTVMVPA
jgi:hypothetical protein